MSMADENKTNIPSKQQKRLMKDAYQGRGAFAGSGPTMEGAGATRAKDSAARQYAATGQTRPEGERQGFFDKLKQRNAERDKEAQQKQYAQQLAQQKQQQKHMGNLMGAGLAGTNKRGAQAFGAMAKNPDAVGGTMGRMAEREAAQKRLNDQQRHAWKKEKRFVNKAKAFAKRPKKLQGIQPKQHSQAVWLGLIGVAVVKDLIDMGTVELFALFDWGVDAVIAIIFYLGLGNVEFAQRLIRSFGPALLEMIPGLGIMPIWTLTVLYIYYRSVVATKLPAKPETKKLPG